MKKLFLFLAVVTMIYGCKKEPLPAPQQQSPTVQNVPDNYFVLDGMNYANDTLAFNEDLYGHWNSPSMTTIIEGFDTVSNSLQFLLSIDGSTTGQFAINQSSITSSYNQTYIGLFNDPDLTVNITRYDTVGGFIEGTVNGTLYSDSVSVTGKFKVPRMPDI